MLRLNDSAISTAVKRAKLEKIRLELADPDHKGLRLRITPAGKASWILGCRDTEGRARRFPLGIWREKDGMGVSDARTAAREMRVSVGKGSDPILDARKRRAATKNASAGIGTLQAVIELYEGQHGKRLRSWPDCRRRIEGVFAKHLSRPAIALSRVELQMTADGWKSSQSAAAAVRYVRPILKWAALRGYVSEELARLVPPAKVGRRQRILSREELAALIPVLRRSDRPYAAALLFLLLTLARREEVGAARWRDIDLDGAIWTIPKTKNNQPHAVPLSTQAIALLRDRLPKPARPAALAFGTSAGSSLSNWDRETKAFMEASGTTGWTRHDLRRTGATMLGEMGELPDIVEAALNHVSIRSALAATYNRSRYRPQVAAALQRLAGALDEIGGAA